MGGATAGAETPDPLAASPARLAGAPACCAAATERNNARHATEPAGAWSQARTGAGTAPTESWVAAAIAAPPPNSAIAPASRVAVTLVPMPRRPQPIVLVIWN